MKKFVVLCIIGIFGLQRLAATHLVGGDLSYRCLGGNRYEINMTIYRDCNSSTALDDPANITIFNLDNNNVITTTMRLGLVQKVNTDAQDPCIINAPDVCLEYGTYKTTVALSPNTNGYKVVYQRCCRNGVIRNIFNPEASGSTYDVTIPGSGISCNSTPVFNNVPPAFLCQNSRFEFNFSATDADGDQLVYSLVAPQLGADQFDPMPVQASYPPYQPVTYQTGYSAIKPLGATSSINIDPNTGLLTCIPAEQGIFVVGVSVSEYRGGNLIGRIMRDFQFVVSNCASTSSIPAVAVDNNNAVYQLDDTTYSSCNGTTVNFKNNSSGNIISSFWDFGDPNRTDDTSNLKNPVYTYSDTGRYHVTLIINRGQSCGDTTTVEVRVYRELKGNFTFTAQCSLNPILFIDSSKSYYNDINSWKWYFGDGDSTQIQNPQHLYGNAGTYNVSLIATTEKGCKVKSTKAVQVYPRPYPRFTLPASACVGAPIKLTNTSTISSGSIVDYIWIDYYNHDTIHAVSPTIYFHDAGTFSIKLIAVSDKGCQDEYSNSIVVQDSIKAGFIYNDSLICKNSSIQLTSTSAGTSISHNWNFGDGGTSTQTNPSHPYTAPGTYPVRLIVSNALCGSDTLIKPIRVYDGLTVNFAATPNCFYNAILFRDSSMATYNDINSWHWTFGDGDSAKTQNSSHTYTTAGTYNVSLTETTAGGCKVTKTGTVTAYPKPVANFTIPPLCLNKSFTLTNTSTISSGAIAQNSWNYISGTSTDKNPTLSFPVSGQHPVKLTVTSDKNCVDTITKVVDITDSIKADFTFNDSLICKLNVTQLNSASLGKNLAHNWNFGDNSTSNQTNPTHQYAAAGSYPIRLVVSNVACGSDTAIKTIRVFDGGLTVNWRALSDCFYKNIFFKDSSVALFNDITGYTWSFGDGDTLHTQNANHQYSTAGTYNASLTVTTSRGCINTVKKDIQAYPQPHADFSVPPVCLYNPFTPGNLSTISTGSITKYIWQLGNGNTSNDTSPAFTLTQLGNYPLGLTAISDHNCRDSISKNISVTDSLLANFIIPKSSFCLGESVVFTDSSIGTNISYNWNLGDNSTSTDTNVQHTYSSANVYPVSLVVSSPACGKDTVVKRIEVNNLPVVDLGGPITLCPGTAQLIRVNGIYDSVIWSNGAKGDTLSATTDLNPLMVTVFKKGCAGSDTLAMNIHCDVYIPTAFSPNYDGTNDVYSLINKNIQALDLKIFNRWGQLIFETHDPALGWDGTYKGQKCVNDEYIYLASGLTADNKPFSAKGSILLIW